MKIGLRVGKALIFLLFVSTAFAAAKSADATLDRAIEKANSEWAASMKTGDAKIIAAPYSDDALFIGIDGSCTKGRVEIEKMYRDRFARGGLAVSTKIESRRVVKDGDLAYESGYGETGMKNEGSVKINGGRYLTVWQLISGNWKIVRNIVLP